jgi:spermidine/putrescine transport system permease protein
MKRIDSLKWGSLTPATFWLVFLFTVPLLVIFVYSFYDRGTHGELIPAFTLDNYLRAFDPLYAGTLWRSVRIALVSTLITLGLGYPVAYYIAQQSAGRKQLFLFLLIIPFWTNFLVRTYAWIFILRTEGLMNTVFMQLGIIKEPLQILFTETAVIIGLVYTYLPFMILPIYVSIEKLDKSLIDAAIDLGANAWNRFRKIIIPLTWPGIAAGCILVFVPSIGAFITPDLLGGARTLMVGNLIQIQFLSARDWPFGAALAFIVMGIVLLLMIVYAWLNQRGSGEKGGVL